MGTAVPAAPVIPEQVRVSPDALAKASEIAAERGLPDETAEPAPVETR